MLTEYVENVCCNCGRKVRVALPPMIRGDTHVVLALKRTKHALCEDCRFEASPGEGWQVFE